MIKVIISGYGKMGHKVEEELYLRGIECVEKTESVQNLNKNTTKESVCIDFTTPEAIRKNYRFLAENFKAVVIGTTGWYDIKNEVIAYFEKCHTPMIWASNFSIGVNVMTAAVSLVSKYLGKAGGYSSYIVEKHHIHKIDAPSGTAKTLAAAIEEGMSVKPDIASVRVGELSGIHTVGFEGTNDRITIEHEAFSRQGFAQGAVTAAEMTESLDGVYEFKELFFGKL